MSNQTPKGFTPASSPSEELVSVQAIPLEKFKFDEIELENVGNTLPIGLFVDGEWLNTFSLHPYKTGHDRILGQLLKANRNKLVPVIGNFFPRVVAEIGGYPIDTLAEKMGTSPNRVFEGMVLGDILSLILAIRLQAQGWEIAMTGVCPNCNTKNEDNPDTGCHDLRTTKVKLLRNLNQKPIVEVVLKNGIDIGEEEPIKRVLMQPLKLHQAEKIAKSNSTPEDLTMLYSMISAIPDVESYRNVRGQVFCDELYDELTKDDLSILRKALRSLQPGPNMEIEMACRACGYEWQEGLQWGRLREFLYLAADSAE